MDYVFHYQELVKTRKKRILDTNVTYEIHHIVPKSMGGTDDESNLVSLTLREHFIAHWLLWRIHRNRETSFSFYIMSNRYSVRSSRAFEEARSSRKQIGFSESTKKKMSVKKFEYYSKNEHYRITASRKGIRYKCPKQGQSLSETHRRKADEFNKLHSYDIFQYDLKGNLVRIWKGLGELREHFGEKGLYIFRVIQRNKSKKSYGYKWEI